MKFRFAVVILASNFCIRHLAFCFWILVFKICWFQYWLWIFKLRGLNWLNCTWLFQTAFCGFRFSQQDLTLRNSKFRDSIVCRPAAYMNSFHPGKGRLRSHSIFDIIFFGLQLNIFHSHYISFSFFAFSQISVLIFNKAVMNFGRKSYRFVYSHILSLAFRFRLSYRVFHMGAPLAPSVRAAAFFFFFFFFFWLVLTRSTNRILVQSGRDLYTWSFPVFFF